MASRYYLDASALVFLILESPEHIPHVVLNSRKMDIFTSTLGYDETVWVVRKRISKTSSYDAADLILSLDSVTIAPISKTEISESRPLMETLDLPPRDSIHLAAAQQNHCSIIVSDDRDFDKATKIKRITSKEFLGLLTQR